MIITVTGHSLSGKSTVSEELARRLGYKYYCAGDIRKKFALKKDMTLAELNKEAESDSYSDVMVDDHIKKIAVKEKDFVVNGRTAFFLIPDSFKLFLDACLDVRAQRLLERHSKDEPVSSFEEAKKLITDRDYSDRKRYKSLYDIDDCYDKSSFDLVVDTSRKTVDETVRLIVDFLKEKRFI